MFRTRRLELLRLNSKPAMLNQHCLMCKLWLSLLALGGVHSSWRPT